VWQQLAQQQLAPLASTSQHAAQRQLAAPVPAIQRVVPTVQAVPEPLPDLPRFAALVIQDINVSAVEIFLLGPAFHAQASLVQDFIQATAPHSLAQPALVDNTRQDVLKQATGLALHVLTPAIRHITALVVQELILVSCLSATLALSVSIAAAALGAMQALAPTAVYPPLPAIIGRAVLGPIQERPRHALRAQLGSMHLAVEETRQEHARHAMATARIP